jgi:uncharacterized protein (TIGR03437 family)
MFRRGLNAAQASSRVPYPGKICWQFEELGFSSMTKNRIKFLLVSFGAAAALHAAPILRLSQTAFGPFPIPQGSNGQTQTVSATNIGTGSLNLQAASSDSWLVATLGKAGVCGSASSCIPVQIALQTAGLAKGTYTGIVTLTDPNAVDSPQNITVTIAVGGNIPDQLTFYAAPNGTVTSTFFASKNSTASAATQTGGGWLSVAGSGVGSFDYSRTFTVKANSTALPAGDYNGTIAVTDSTLGNKNVASVLHVTASPIAQPLFPAIQLQIASGAAKQNYPLPTAGQFYPLVTNAGQGTLTVSGVTSTTSSGGNWLTLQTDANNFAQLTADATGLSPGKYQGTVTVASNAANSPTVIPVQLTVLAAGPPAANVGVANGFTNSPDDGIALGDFVALFGTQFTTGDAQTGTLPLTTTLGSTQVLLNGTAVPVQYVSASQINLQIPYNAQVGDGTLTVVRNGQQGNTLSVHISGAAPVLLPFGGGYVVAQTPTGGFEGFPPSYPAAHAGDTLVLYAVGLGPTSPAVTAGTASPSDHLAVVTPTPKLCFGSTNPLAGGATCITPDFVGLTPTYFALYQINFRVPDSVHGNAVPIFLTVGGTNSNVLAIAIQ